MIITIDGPAGAGKSTIAKQLAARLGFEYLDTGSMYRAVALAGIRHSIDWNAPESLIELAKNMQITLRQGKTFLNGEDVTTAVRTQEVTQHTRFAANNPTIRGLMVQQQRQVAAELHAAGKSLVTEGRDQGSAVFPDAECKIFLTATPEERARRRLSELRQRHEPGEFDDILQQINRRDAEDAAREVGPLVRPAGSVELVTDGLDIDAVLERLCAIVSEKKVAQSSP